MSKHILWLHHELAKWTADGLVTPEQAAQLLQRYPRPAPGRPWGMIVFASLGAIVFGLGIILLFAYNWAAMPKYVKLACVLGPLVAAHGVGVWLHLRSERYRALGEALTVLGTMLFGAGIWLVAQIYHIEEQYPNGVLIWGVGALALAWALPSVAQALMACVLLAVWDGMEGLNFHAPQHWAPLVMVGLLVSLAWQQRSRVLLTVALPATGFTLLLNLGLRDEHLILVTLLNLAALFIAASILLRRRETRAELAPICAFYGWLAYFIVIFILTFPDAADHLLDLHWRTSKPGVGLLYWLVTLLPALAAWGAVIVGRAPPGMLSDQYRDCPLDFYLVPLSLLMAQVPPLLIGGEQWMAAPFNFVFLAHAGAFMARGCREGRLRPTIVGAVLLCFLAFGRYFDLFDNLATRGLVFLIVGGALFGEGILYSRARKAKAAAEAAAPSAPPVPPAAPAPAPAPTPEVKP